MYMKIILDNNNIVIESPFILSVLGRLIGFSKKTRPAMGMALPFCIIMYDLQHPMYEVWMNHERTHIRQMGESLGIAFIIAKIEYLYARLILKYSHIEANRFECIEQECYLNQTNADYLQNRKLWSFVKYIKNKTDFYIDEEYRVVVKYPCLC